MRRLSELFDIHTSFFKRSYFYERLKMSAGNFHNKLNPNQRYEKFTTEQVAEIRKILEEINREITDILEEGIDN